MRNFLLCLLLSFSAILRAQTYPQFGREIPVTITGDTVPDAMEPFISFDGKYMFFNSLNNGTTTTLYYAIYTNDSTFSFQGRLNGANLINPPHLDAVASMDTGNRFVWVTTRNYPSTYHNVMRGKFTGNSVIDTGRMLGNIYINIPGWIVMDCMLNYSGNRLYCANAYFNGCAGGVPCISQLNVASMVNDSTYNVMPTSAAQLAKVDDTGYDVYAPNTSFDDLELYYTRLKHGTFQTEVCVSVRNTITDTFSLPSVIYTDPLYVIEAPTISTDKMRLYYHKKQGSNFKLYLRYRIHPGGVNDIANSNDIHIYPNPATNQIHIDNLQNQNEDFFVDIYDAVGRCVMHIHRQVNVNTSLLAKGVYTLVIRQKGMVFEKKLIIL